MCHRGETSTIQSSVNVLAEFVLLLQTNVMKMSRSL